MCVRERGRERIFFRENSMALPRGLCECQPCLSRARSALESGVIFAFSSSDAAMVATLSRRIPTNFRVGKQGAAVEGGCSFLKADFASLHKCYAPVKTILNETGWRTSYYYNHQYCKLR